ncbi:SRPBCC family protein [Actinomadura sp. WMMB 499]|uniref:SRPBCC family protein n=1 Tax=Actinomadura sp. WMMB 499 TaxID=1219491 RepID=UPI001248C42B|nr:SRPBCC family protein [Actinomadura sp. WMMB 499]QFG22941.1 toxin-antitoxin system toxin subunit [Actinomadura sp. WMMB 499]
MPVAGTLEIADGRYSVRFERRLPHSVDQVWRAVSDPAVLAEWFPAEIELELREGGTVRQSFPGDIRMPPGTVTACDPPRLLEFVESSEGLPLAGAGDDRLMRYELTPDGDGCVLVFVNAFGDRAGAASFATGWETCLDALEQVLDGKEVSVPENFASLHEQYVASFGPPDGSAERGPDGWTVAFERQLPYPKDATWEALAGAAPDATALASGDAVPPGFTAGFAAGGTVTEADAPKALEFRAETDGAAAGTVRWRMEQGPGGARIHLTHTLPEQFADRRVEALAAWHARLERLADELGDGPPSRPSGRVEEFEEHYRALNG